MTLGGVKSVLRMLPKATIVLLPDHPQYTIAEVNNLCIASSGKETTDLIGRRFADSFLLNVANADPEAKALLDSLANVMTSKTARQIKIRRDILGLKSLDSAETPDVNLDIFPILSDNNEVEYIVQVVSDAAIPILPAEQADGIRGKRSAEFERLEKAVLELNSKKGYAIQDVLSFYIHGIERLSPGTLCSILELRNHRLYNLSSPSLPETYIDALEGREVGEDAGSCGSSAFLKEIVIVTDISSDPRWNKYKELAIQSGLKACWSHPIIDSEGEVIATFATYYRKTKKPNNDELMMTDRAVSLLKVILENRKNSEILKETTLLMTQGQELAHFGNWAWDVKNNIVKWSDSLYDIYGLDKNSFKATFEGYLELLHPDERARVQQIIQNVLHTKKDVEFEESIIRPNGEIRHLKSWGKLRTDEKGEPEKMIGACLDITESKKIQEELLASETRLRSLAWAQSHLVRGPLTRIMGITELLCRKDTDDSSRSQLLNYLDSSATELDKVIKEIVNKSY